MFAKRDCLLVITLLVTGIAARHSHRPKKDFDKSYPIFGENVPKCPEEYEDSKSIYVDIPSSFNYPDVLEEPKDVLVEAHSISRTEGCSIGTNNGDLSIKQPLLVEPGADQILLPSKTGKITIDADKSIEMYCTAGFTSPLSGKKVLATCVDGNVFSVEGNQLNITDIKCTSQLANKVRKTGRTCYGGAAILEIGFETPTHFFRVMEICHNIPEENTHYAHYKLYSSSVAFQRSIPRVQFIPGAFYNGKDVNRLYTQNSQMKTIGKILGSGYEKYFDIKRDVYFARGHMAAKADFIYAPEQLATFYFINAAPQWQIFNAGNWERVEAGVKNFAAARNADFDTYTGTWGVLTLPDHEGMQQPLYLAFDHNNNGLIPVPKIYYRVIIDKTTKSGIAMIGVNNPHATLDEIKSDYILCDDVSDRITWINWEKTNIKKGYSYACEVNQFANKIGQLPPLDVTGLLY